jgi:hypothetical protein
MTKARFQPDHGGRHTPVAVHPGMAVSHLSHGAGEHVAGHSVPGNIARDGAPKNINPVPVHGGMVKQTKSGPLAFGGDHAAAIDALSGREVVPGKDGSVANALPLTAPPVAKNFGPVAVSPGMKRQTGNVARSLDDASPTNILGVMLMDEGRKP